MSDTKGVGRWDMESRDLIADALAAINPDDPKARQQALSLAVDFRPTDDERKAVEWAAAQKEGEPLRCFKCDASHRKLWAVNPGVELADIDGYDGSYVQLNTDNGEFETGSTLVCQTCNAEMPFPEWVNVDYSGIDDDEDEWADVPEAAPSGS
jgi:hypothetical protein